MQASESLTSPINLAESTLGDIAVKLPGATAIFRAADLDYCCGGQITLKDAVAAASLDLEKIIADLANLRPEQAPAAVDLDASSLVDIIITRYHRVHSQELPELIRLAALVENVHRNHPLVPAGLAPMLQQILGELTIHMQREELMLFPLMRKGGPLNLEDPVTVMMAEHDEHGAHLQALRNRTQDFQTPDDGCATWRALYAGLAKFADDLIEHIHTENNILFPRFLGSAS